jgi:ArsR family transcriptional regulator
LEERAKVFKALAHPTRLFIIEALAGGPRCVCDLTERIGADISTVSKHLSVMKNAGILSDSKSGNMVFYSLKMPCVLSFFRCVDGSNALQEG